MEKLNNTFYENGKQIELLGNEFVCNRLRIFNWLTNSGIPCKEQFRGFDGWVHWVYNVDPDLVKALNAYCDKVKNNIEYRQA